MLHKQNLLKTAGAALMLMSITTMSCNMNDDKAATETTTVSATDTTTLATTPPVGSDPAMNGAVGATENNGTISPSNGGVAKPDPAKKGKKGKVMITLSPKGSGSMEPDNSGVYTNVEFIPTFPGGNKGLQAFFDKNIQYPDDATEEGVDGTVDVTFIVDETGKLSSPSIQGQTLGYGLEAEALRVVSIMPSWNPGKLKGKNVKTRYTLPIRFELN